MFCLNASDICLLSPTLFQKTLPFQTSTWAFFFFFFCQSFVAKARLGSMRLILLGQIISCSWSLKFISNINFFLKALLYTRPLYMSSWQDKGARKPCLYMPSSLSKSRWEKGRIKRGCHICFNSTSLLIIELILYVSFSCHDFALTVRFLQKSGFRFS